ncbi:MAG: ACP S-malonyltransferase [Deltaproteobacteria bacterium]|nr:ACP S-malonyltransferase [Deltaproteobacteria bacterium]
MTKLALVFPGQGSQFVGMGKDFHDNFRESKLVYEEASDTIRVDLRKLCFDGPLDELTLTPNLQPALFVTEAAMLAALRAHAELDVVVAAGHSLGEYTALHAAGSLTVADGARLTRLRGTEMAKAVPPGRGTMAAVLGLEAAQVEALCAKARSVAKNELVEPANFNAPGQVVIAGTVDGVAQAAALLKDDPEFKGGRSIPLQVSAPFHCSLMEPARKAMAPVLAAAVFGEPRFKVIPNVSAQPELNQHTFAGLLTDQITRSVRWEQSMRQLRALGVETLVEVGPGRVLVGLHKRIDRELPTKSVGTIEQLKEFK